MQHVLVDLQEEKSSSYSILIFVILLFGCPPALDAWGRGPVRPPPLCTPLVINRDALEDKKLGNEKENYQLDDAISDVIKIVNVYWTVVRKVVSLMNLS